MAERFCGLFVVHLLAGLVVQDGFDLLEARTTDGHPVTNSPCEIERNDQNSRRAKKHAVTAVGGDSPRLKD